MSESTQIVPFVDLKSQYADISADVARAVERVFSNAQFIMGPDLASFEAEFAAYIGTTHCVGVESGTAALKVALEALGVGHGDEVIVPANTYIACAFAVSQIGAIPVMVDVDDCYLIDPKLIERSITSRTRVIMPVHLYGQSADISAITEIAKKHNLKVLEDCSQSHGAMSGGKRLGSFGDAAAFSFYPGKNLGAYGDGGAVTTNDPDVADRIRLLRDFGQRRKYEHLIIADNCRLDTVQAAILRIKLQKIDEWNARRQAAAQIYDANLSAIGLKPPECRNIQGHVYHLYVVQVPQRDKAIHALSENGVQTGIHYPIPIHMQPAYRHLQLPEGSFPNTERFAGQILSLPMFPEITRQQIDRVTDVLHRHIEASRAIA